MLLSLLSYSSTSASGTKALTMVESSTVSVPLLRPRRLLLPPITSPIAALGAGRGRGRLEGLAAGELEGGVGRVDVVVLAVVEAHLHVDHREAGEEAAG